MFGNSRRCGILSGVFVQEWKAHVWVQQRRKTFGIHNPQKHSFLLFDHPPSDPINQCNLKGVFKPIFFADSMPSTLSHFQTFLPSQIAFSMPLLGEATKRAPTGGDKTCTAGSFSLPSIHSRTSSGQVGFLYFFSFCPILKWINLSLYLLVLLSSNPNPKCLNSSPELVSRQMV